MKAYPNVTKETTAHSSASRLLRNAKVADYIADRTKAMLEAQKMTGDEIIVELVSIARREKKEAYFEEYDHLLDEVTIKSTRTFQPSIEEANKALETLVKWAGLDNPNNDLVRRKLMVEVGLAEKELENLKQADGTQEDKTIIVNNLQDERMKKWVDENGGL